MPVVLVIVSAICFGTTGTAQHYGPDAASASAVGLTRIVAGGVLLGLLAVGVARRRRGSDDGAVRLPSWIVLLGGLGVLAYQLTFFAGVRLNGVAVGAVVTLGAAPVLTGLLEWVVTRVRPSGAWIVATVCAVVGVVLLSGLVGGGDQPLSGRGVLASLGAALSYAVYTLAAKRLIDGGATPTVAIGSVFALAALLGLPLLAFVDLAWAGSADGALMIGWLAVVTVVLAYVLFAAGLRHLPAATVSTLTLAEPLTASVLGLWLLHEHLSPTAWIGLAVLGLGVLVLATSRPAREETPLS